jgi:hypothetical protein
MPDQPEGRINQNDLFTRLGKIEQLLSIISEKQKSHHERETSRTQKINELDKITSWHTKAISGGIIWLMGITGKFFS